MDDVDAELNQKMPRMKMHNVSVYGYLSDQKAVQLTKMFVNSSWRDPMLIRWM